MKSRRLLIFHNVGEPSQYGGDLRACCSFAASVHHARSSANRWKAAYCDSANAQGLVLRPGLKLASPKELEGKTLAFTEGTAPILILTGLAKKFGFDAKKVKIQNMNQSEGIVATSRGDVDGFLGFEPNKLRL